jgi:AraC family transcriptional regulator of adaptative response/methylated-DNA-[protein]-cysteine methyltransferase
MKKKLFITRFRTPLGEITACSTVKGICLLEFSDRHTLDNEIAEIAKKQQIEICFDDDFFLNELKKQMIEYFDGSRMEFRLPLHLIGTEFQEMVWNYLISIPYGHTKSYSDQAKELGMISALRAIAHANAVNRIAILIPCHRVLGKNGRLTGYRGGVERKRKLILHEQKHSESSLTQSLFSELN